MQRQCIGTCLQAEGEGGLEPYLREVLGYSPPSIGVRYFRVLQVHDPLPHVLVEQHRLVMASWGMRERDEAWDVPREPQAPSPVGQCRLPGSSQQWTRSSGAASGAPTQQLTPTGTAVTPGSVT